MVAQIILTDQFENTLFLAEKVILARGRVFELKLQYWRQKAE